MIRYVNAAGENETDLPWPLVDTQDGMKPYLPKAGARIPADGQVKIYEPTEDNLIITRLPNFFASDSATHPSVWPQIVCLEGSNGIGTRAAELLVQPEGLEALQSLKKRLNGATAFQALFRAYGLEKTHDGIHRYRRIELREWSVTPLAVTPQHLQRAYATAMARLTAHGGGIQI
jgi:hypothetical protein